MAWLDKGARGNTQEVERNPMKAAVLVFCGCCDKVSPAGQLKTTEMDSVVFLEAENLRSRSWQPWVLLRALGEDSPWLLSQHVVMGSSAWCSSACITWMHCSNLYFVVTWHLLCVSLCPNFPPDVWTPDAVYKSTLTQYDLILT